MPLDATTTTADLLSHWQSAWPAALRAWSNFTLLREPRFLENHEEAGPWGMAGEIAAIRLRDQTVLVNLQQVRELGLESLALPILAHEIGHHVYVPANLADHARMLGAIQPMLFGLGAETAHLVANLYGDLLINDRLTRRSQVPVEAVYRKLRQALRDEDATRVWKVYTRTYEHLWRLPNASLSPAGVTDEMHADAALIARLIRNYAGEWLRGARRFACILYPYLQEDEGEQHLQTFRKLGLCDTRGACRGEGEHEASSIPDGLATFDPSELVSNDEFERELDELAEGERRSRRKRRPARAALNRAPGEDAAGKSRGQHREPFEYGELLRALGLDLSQHEVTTRYYRERALPHLIPFPTRRSPRALEPLAEGYQSWEADQPLEDLDLFGSLLLSPQLIPGVTTVERVFGQIPGHEPQRKPVDLDVYVDCSGSMPNPAVHVSYLALCATILCASALRAGARVQATLWSGPGQFETTQGFLRDENRILGIVTGFLAGSTAFPLHVMRNTYAERKPDDASVHIVVISDDGVDTLLAQDERATPGESIARQALLAARGGGTLVLNLPDRDWPPRTQLESLGFRIHRVTDWEQLIAFARAFVREQYS